MTTKSIKDGAGAPFNADLNLVLGRRPVVDTRSLNLCNEDKAVLDQINTAIANIESEIGNLNSTMTAPATSLPPFELGKVSRYSRKIIDISSSAEAAQIAGVAGDTIRVHYFHLITPVAANELAVWNGPVSDGLQLDLRSFAGAGAGHTYGSASDPIWVTSADKGLVFKPTGTARITGLLLYTQD